MPLPSYRSIPIPSPLASFYSHFPLLTYPSTPLTSTPSKPTLWLLGPPPSPLSESLDPACRSAQTGARFVGVEVEIRWWTTPEGAPGGVLPALHLPNGDLLGSEEVGAYFTRAGTQKEEAKVADPTYQAYTSLLRTSLLPAVLSSLYLSPTTSTRTRVIPDPKLPFLSSLIWYYFLSGPEKKEWIEQVKRLRGKRMGRKDVLDLEEVERDGVEAMGALEVKLKESGAEGWYGGANSPTQLDAELYALLSIIQLLPSSQDAQLKSKLERCPTLTAWVKRRTPTS